jgi:hypothetical protein
MENITVSHTALEDEQYSHEKKALNLANKAIAADKNEEYDTAYTLYMSSLDWFMIAMKCKDPDTYSITNTDIRR